MPEEVSNFWICSGCINQTVLVKNKAYFTRIPLVCETRILSDSTIFFFWKLFTFYFFVKNYCINNLRLMTMKTNVFQNIKSENWLSHIFLLWTLPSYVLQNQIIRLLGKLDTFFLYCWLFFHCNKLNVKAMNSYHVFRMYKGSFTGILPHIVQLWNRNEFLSKEFIGWFIYNLD